MRDTRNYLEKRFIPEGFQELRADDVNIVCYIGEDGQGRPVAICYSGKKSKNDFYNRFKDVASMDKKIEDTVARARKYKVEKAEYQAEKKLRAKEFKASIKVGNYIRTTFSYNMTFNDFYEVLSIKGAKVTLAVVKSEWVSGDAGYTGQVSCTSERTSKVVEGKFTTAGLKIQDRYGRVCTLEENFYENHMD